MTISQRQFKLLNAMEIPLWVSKQSTAVSSEQSSQTESHINSEVEDKSAETVIAIDLSILLENQLFNDILLTLGASPTEISIENNVLNINKNDKNIFWQFEQVNTLSFQQDLLITPSIDQIEMSPDFKRNLWLLMIEKELICQ